MTYYHRTVHCPHCGKIAEHTRTTSKTMHGTPFRVCPHCRQTYYDSEYTEEAILRYRNTGHPTPFKGLLTFILMGGVTYGVVQSILQEGMNWFLLALSIIFGLLSLAGLYMFIVDIPQIFRKNEYKREELRKLEEYLGGPNVEGDTKASMQRMSNPLYVRSLILHGVDVPEFFLKRLGDTAYYELNDLNKRNKKETSDDTKLTGKGVITQDEIKNYSKFGF